jgi:hypothetical protein
MNDIIIGFVFGFACAVLCVARVSIRPSAKKALKKIGVVKLHEARVPKAKEIELD